MNKWERPTALWVAGIAAGVLFAFAGCGHNGEHAARIAAGKAVNPESLRDNDVVLEVQGMV